MEEKPTYPANRDARAQLTEIESATSRRVHRLDRICGNKPAKLLDFKSLTLRSGSSRFGPVYLYFWSSGRTLVNTTAREDRLWKPVNFRMRRKPDALRPSIVYTELNRPMPLSVGDKLGPYEILAPIGVGGMGEVWKARDTRLDRIVAIKTSAERFSERFEREARAIAALNHPHICQIYDVGPDYLVMEFVDGQELKGPLPPDLALKAAIQLAAALEAAHRKSITHRDLKPANILNTKSGVKVLDFGLAKFEVLKPARGEETQTRALTDEGTIVGTL